jgi:hypothetical protein
MNNARCQPGNKMLSSQAVVQSHIVPLCVIIAEYIYHRFINETATSPTCLISVNTPLHADATPPSAVAVGQAQSWPNSARSACSSSLYGVSCHPAEQASPPADRHRLPTGSAMFHRRWPDWRLSHDQCTLREQPRAVPRWFAAQYIMSTE